MDNTTDTDLAELARRILIAENAVDNAMAAGDERDFLRIMAQLESLQAQQTVALQLARMVRR